MCRLKWHIDSLTLKAVKTIIIKKDGRTALHQHAETVGRLPADLLEYVKKVAFQQNCEIITINTLWSSGTFNVRDSIDTDGLLSILDHFDASILRQNDRFIYFDIFCSILYYALGRCYSTRNIPWICSPPSHEEQTRLFSTIWRFAKYVAKHCQTTNKFVDGDEDSSTDFLMMVLEKCPPIFIVEKLLAILNKSLEKLHTNNNVGKMIISAWQVLLTPDSQVLKDLHSQLWLIFNHQSITVEPRSIITSSIELNVSILEILILSENAKLKSIILENPSRFANTVDYRSIWEMMQTQSQAEYVLSLRHEPSMVLPFADVMIQYLWSIGKITAQTLIYAKTVDSFNYLYSLVSENMSQIDFQMIIDKLLLMITGQNTCIQQPETDELLYEIAPKASKSALDTALHQCNYRYAQFLMDCGADIPEDYQTSQCDFDINTTYINEKRRQQSLHQ